VEIISHTLLLLCLWSLGLCCLSHIKVCQSWEEIWWSLWSRCLI